MKKYLIIIIIIVALGALYFYSNRPQYYEKSSLVDIYKVLSNESEWKQKRVPLDSKDSWYIQSQGNQIKIRPENYEGDFYCGEDKARFFKYKSYSNPKYIGAWSSTSIIDCSDYYLVFTYGDNGPHLFGPFNKQED